MRLAGKVAVVTGAAGGIGEATVVRFAQEGARVACVDVALEGAERAAALAERESGSGLALVCDVSTQEGNRKMVEETVRAFGGLDVLHANAAVQVMGRLESTSAEVWDRLEATNLRGVYLGVKEALPRLRERGGGSVLMTSSLLGIVGDKDLPVYGAMKGGLRALCRSLAAAYGPDNIRVNTICPGDVDTPMVKQFFEHQPDGEAARRETLGRYPLGRFATPTDVANVAVFLASDEAAYLSGIDVVVDGGLLAQIY